MAEQIDCSAKQEWRKMDQKIEKFRGILNELVNEILDIGSSFNIAIGTASDELDENYEDGCYYTQVIIHEDFTATVNQYKKGDEELPPDEEFPDFDKDLIPESKCWNLPKREVLAHLAAIISPWIEDYLSKMKNGIDTLVKINVTCPTAIESLALLSLIYDRGKSVSTEFKQHKDPKSFVGDFEGYLSAYCDIDKIGARFEELQVRMGFEPVKPAKTGRKTIYEKFAAIAKYLEAKPFAKSKEIGEALGIDDSDVRRLWMPIKQAMQQEKPALSRGYKNDGIIGGVDESASCKYCMEPLMSSFECSLCKGMVIGECKTCHFTQQHPDVAVP